MLFFSFPPSGNTSFVMLITLQVWKAPSDQHSGVIIHDFGVSFPPPPSNTDKFNRNLLS